MRYLSYRSILLVIIYCATLSCEFDSDINTSQLEGYWEIETVTLKNGLKKEYTFSETIDFLAFTDSLSGIRKKMKPNFNGYFETSNDAERFEIKIENDSVNMYYKTPFDSWKETILKLNENQLVVINKNNAIFTYKRYEPITIN